MVNEYKEHMNSQDWLHYKKSIIEQRGLECEKCFLQAKHLGELHLHHKNYDQEHSMEKDKDMMLLCHECHAKMHQDVEFFDQKNPNDVLLNGTWE